MGTLLLAGLELSAKDINAYGLVIGGSAVVILSYFANLLARRTNIPSVLVLIGMGIGIRQGLEAVGLHDIPFEGLILELLGTVGLIFIVLEAALELELRRDKLVLILRSGTLALLALGASTMAIAYFLEQFLGMPWFTAVVYGIPLSIMSSAIIIPSVGGLSPASREFMVYESTFSDIFGIMAFYLLLGNQQAASSSEVLTNIAINLFGTLAISIVVAYLMVYVLQKIESGVRLFLSIAVLLLIYAIQKLFHLSPLILILIFGLMLNNHKLFFPDWFGLTNGWPGKLLKDEHEGPAPRLPHPHPGERVCHPNLLLCALRNDRQLGRVAGPESRVPGLGHFRVALPREAGVPLCAAPKAHVAPALHRATWVDHRPAVLRHRVAIQRIGVSRV